MHSILFKSPRLNGILLTVLLAPILSGCDLIREKVDGVFDQRISEGVIHYKVSFPYSEESGLMASLLPDEMTMWFKDNIYVTELSAGMGMFKTRFIADSKEHRLTHMLKIMNKKMVLELDSLGTQEFLKDFPAMTVLKAQGMDSIAGAPCQRAVGIYHAPSKRAMNIFYTDRVDIDQPNWCNQFQVLDGVLLYYEMERFGKRMRLEATSIEHKSVDDKVFSTEGYDPVSKDQMKAKMEEIVKSFNS